MCELMASPIFDGHCFLGTIDTYTACVFLCAPTSRYTAADSPMALLVIVDILLREGSGSESYIRNSCL